jgi:hypothetical protein
MLTTRYRKEFPYYLPALALNYVQFGYALLPEVIRRSTHTGAVRVKRAMAH